MRRMALLCALRKEKKDRGEQGLEPGVALDEDLKLGSVRDQAHAANEGFGKRQRETSEERRIIERHAIAIRVGKNTTHGAQTRRPAFPMQREQLFGRHQWAQPLVSAWLGREKSTRPHQCQGRLAAPPTAQTEQN